MEKNIKGVIQIIHGMSEHKKRYSHFFNFFEKRGWKVIAEDHIHHGEKIFSLEKAGIFEDDFYKIIEDQISLTKNIKNKYPDIPIFIFGHSMGSFAAQEHMKKSSDIVTGCIFCGSCYEQKFLWKAGKYISFILDKIYKNKRAELIKKMIFFNSNGKIKKDEYFNENSWLSRDAEEVRKYTEDKLCGFTYSSGFYRDFFIFLNNLYKKEYFQNVRKNIPILIISGEMDFVGLYGKGVRNLEKFYRNMNFKNVECRLYKGARHELHNEINREEVFLDIEKWLEKNI